MRRSLRLPARAVAVLAAGVLALTACGSGGGTSSGASQGPSGSSSSSGGGANQASAPGITATEVTIGSHQPLSGPAAPGYSEIAPSSEAMFKYINDQGGINGRTIKYIYKDDMYDPTKTVQVVRELVLQDKVFAIFDGLGTPTHTKVLDFLNSQKIPDLFVASGATNWNQPKKYPYTFGWQTDYVTEGKILGKYIADNFKGKKVGYFFQNDDFGQDGVKGLDTQIPADQVVDRQSYVTSALAQPGGLGPQIASLKAKGAEVVVFFTIPAATAVAKLTALQLGYNPQLAVTNVGSDPTTLNGLLKKFSQGKADQQALEGIVTDGYLPPTGDMTNPWISLFKKVHDQYVPNLPFDGNVEFGMAVAYTFAQALKAAGQNPTRDGLVKAVEKNDFQGPGLTPLRFSPTDHGGYAGTQIGIIQGGAIKLQGNPETTDVGTGPIKDFTETPAKPGDNGILKP